MTTKEITQDLREIKYFYSRQSSLDISSKSFDHVNGIDKVRKYKAIIETAPLQLLDTYVLIYIEGLSADEAAEEVGVSYQTINRRVNQVKKFLAEKLVNNDK